MPTQQTSTQNPSVITEANFKLLANNPKFSECISEAAPHRVTIIKDIIPEMRKTQKEFAVHLAKARYAGISQELSTIIANGKRIPRDLKLEYTEWNKKVSKLFKTTLKTIHPNENQTPSLSMLYVSGQLLNYIGRQELILENPNYDFEKPIKFSPLEQKYPYFAAKNVQAEISALFAKADSIQTEWCQEADTIKQDIFESLPEELICTKKNKAGLKKSHFEALVTTKAFGIMNEPEKFARYLNLKLEEAAGNIIREKLIHEKTQTL